MSAMTPGSGTSDSTEYLLLTPQKLITGSKKELLAVLKKVDPTGFAPPTMPELRIALLKIAFSQNPALQATLRRASSNKSLPKQLDDQDLPPTTATACSTSPSTPVTRPHASSDERPAQQESADSQTPSTSSPNDHELKQLKQQLHARSIGMTRSWKREREANQTVCFGFVWSQRAGCPTTKECEV